MKEVIYLRVTRHRVEGMTKRLPELSRGEIPVKLVIEVDDTAFREPVIEQRIRVSDWRQGIDIADVEIREGIITEDEAALIRERRLAAMQQVLIDHGYEVVPPEDDEGGEPG